MRTDRWRREEHARVIFERMLNRRQVWVDSPAGQMTHISGLALEPDGEVIAYDDDGNDRLATEYLVFVGLVCVERLTREVQAEEVGVAAPTPSPDTAR